MFPSICNGSSLHATRILPGGRANASAALATLAEPSSHLPNSSVTSPVAHQKSGVRNSCRTSTAVAGIGENHPSVAWGTGGELESVLSGNSWMAAAVLSPGGVLININNKKVVDITTSTFPLPTPIRVC